MPNTDVPASREPAPLWTDTDVAAYLRDINVKTLGNWRAAGKGPPFIRIGGGPSGRGSMIRYRPAAVEAWARSQEHGGDQ